MENLILLQEPRQPARYLFSRLNPSHIALILLTCFYYLARFRRTNGPRSWIRELSLFVFPRSILRPTYTITHSMRFTIDKNGNRVSARTVHRLLILSPMWTWRWSLRQARWPSVDRNKLLGSWELSRIRCLSTVSSLLLCWTGQTPHGVHRPFCMSYFNINVSDYFLNQSLWESLLRIAGWASQPAVRYCVLYPHPPGT